MATAMMNNRSAKMHAESAKCAPEFCASSASRSMHALIVDIALAMSIFVYVALAVVRLAAVLRIRLLVLIGLVQIVLLSNSKYAERPLNAEQVL